MPSARTAAKPFDLSALRLLVVDDNALTARLARDVLRAAGTGSVHVATSAEAALNGLVDWRPDLMFVDWQMPQMDGLDLIRTIRRAAVHPDPAIPDPQVAIVMLTGRRRLQDVEAARAAGADAFVAKPFTPGGLLGRIEALLSQPRDFVVAGDYVGPDRRRRRAADYFGPMRRAVDPGEAATEVERDLARRSMGVELQALRRLAQARGGADRDTLQMCYRTMQNAAHRARTVRDTAIEQASGALLRYMQATGPAQADPAVVEAHMDGLFKLLDFAHVDARKLAAVKKELDRLPAESGR